MIIGQDLEMALGLPVMVTSFSDKIPRKCYPFTLADLHNANLMLSSFNNDSLEANIGKEYSMVAITSIINQAFRDDDQLEIWNGIDEVSFPEIIRDIKEASGIITDSQELDIEKSTTSLSWKKSVAAVQVFTANTFLDIQKMTLRVFNSVLSEVGVNINWKYKTGIVANIKDPDHFISNDEHPLAPDVQTIKKTQMTMKDLDGLMKIER